ncbi:hypothetical protein BDF19DRAFT_454227 [Syncephalis fuscata]|nr:hypothetical protein BDF19DRAFT_454227 [Syncephalis fuscata]
MPPINPNDPKETEWLKNATYLWGIPLNPRARTYYLRSMLAQTVFPTMVSYLFIRNFIISIKVITKNCRNFPAWCCFIASLSGIMFSIESVLLLFSAGVSCRMLIWSAWFGISFAQFCNKKWILYIGVPLMLPQLCFGVLIIYQSFITMDPVGGCGIRYPYTIPLYWFGVIMSINLLFSIIFCRVAYRQYCRFGSDAWKQLAHDGIQTMCLATLCNIGCCFLIVFHVTGNYSDVLFTVDWAIVSTLLVNHCRSIRKVQNMSNRPKTYCILNISEINTARLIEDKIVHSAI